ncbi:multidrug efflux pump subunit AcrA (membrane-fusion protein) [Streptomyces sp. SAI-126]|uniref:hypothetical protein n=1 Tax=Streptomyces sp. SAI-126 TaxID=3377732 RepID=UPI003C7C5F6B
MATTYREPRKPGNRSDQTQSRPCADCDPSGLDSLTCEAEGIKKQAEVTTAAATKLAERRTKYDSARTNYTQSRSDAEKTVDESRRQHEQLVERLKCALDDRRVIKRLGRALDTVRAKLAECGGSGGCCAEEECDFDTDVSDAPLTELYARRADITRHIEQAEKCFDDLIDEPEQLTKRVAAIKAELAQTGEALGKADKGQLVGLYARLLIVDQGLDDVWRGFATANDYVDCLCRALTCSLKGWQAVAVVEGAIAAAECREKADEARCAALRVPKNLVEELLAQYSKLARQSDEDEEAEED